MDGVCPSSVPSNFWELPKKGRRLSIVRGTVSVCRPFRPIFGSFQKMDGVCPSSVQLNFWEFPKEVSFICSVQFLGASKKTDGVCPSSVPFCFWELPRKGRCLSVVRAVQFLGASKKLTESAHCPCCPIFGSFRKMDEVYRNWYAGRM
jgi:hypothetical protein